MVKSKIISLLFFLIFLLGILGVIVYVNQTLDKKSSSDFIISPKAVVNLSAGGSYL